ncbi:hypothetical protein TFLX_05675 [Thermoflexales bacterium]|nr:hypothetical protein TFLX_05675 [Thermoflexales bacterium]
MTKRTLLALIAILLLSTALLFYDLGGPSLSVDEFTNVLIERGSLPHLLEALRLGADLHPPLTHLVMNGWLSIVKETEWTVRLPWVVVGLLNILLVYRLGQQLINRHVGLLAALLVATAPTFILYMRFEKYYSLTILLSLALILAGLRLWRRPNWRSASVYGVVLVMLLYTDYFAPLFLVLGQDVLVLLYGRTKKRILFFGLPQVIAAVLYLPWFSLMLVQVRAVQGLSEADLGASWSGLLIKLGYWGYSLSVGETLFPWRITAIIGLLVTLLLGAVGVRALWGKVSAAGDVRPLPTMVWLLVTPVLGAALLASFSFLGVPFIAFPNHILFTLPLFLLFIAAGLAAVPRTGWLIVVMAAFFLPRGVALYNYYTGQEFHNPIYTVPIREITQNLRARVQSGDVIISDPDTGFQYYYDQDVHPAPALASMPQSTALLYVQTQHPTRVWLLTLGRDRTREAAPDQLVEWLNANYRLVMTQGYAPQAETYRKVKEQLLHRPSYEFKLLIQLFEQP